MNFRSSSGWLWIWSFLASGLRPVKLQEKSFQVVCMYATRDSRFVAPQKRPPVMSCSCERRKCLKRATSWLKPFAEKRPGYTLAETTGRCLAGLFVAQGARVKQHLSQRMIVILMQRRKAVFAKVMKWMFLMRFLLGCTAQALAGVKTDGARCGLMSRQESACRPLYRPVALFHENKGQGRQRFCDFGPRAHRAACARQEERRQSEAGQVNMSGFRSDDEWSHCRARSLLSSWEQLPEKAASLHSFFSIWSCVIEGSLRPS